MLKKPEKKVPCCDCGRKRDPFWPIYQVNSDTGDRTVLWCCRQCFRDHDYAEFMGQQMGPV